MSLGITTKNSTVLGKSKSRKLGVNCWSPILNCACSCQQAGSQNQLLSQGRTCQPIIHSMECLDKWPCNLQIKGKKGRKAQDDKHQSLRSGNVAIFLFSNTDLHRVSNLSITYVNPWTMMLDLGVPWHGYFIIQCIKDSTGTYSLN